MTKARNLADLLDGSGIVNNSKITLDANEIPSLDASKIVSGDISAARLSLATETKPVVSSVSPSVISNDAQNIVITGTDFTAIPRVDIINTATGIWYSVNTVTHDSATQLTVNLTLSVDAGTYRIRVENPDGLAGLSGANFLTVSDAPTWSTSAGSLGTKTGGLNGAVATVSAGGDTIVYSETTNVLTNASLANCSLNSSTGAITTSDFDGSSTSARTHTFTIRATDAQGQTSDREFSLTSSYVIASNWLVVAGGGSGGAGYYAGGAGAGGYRTSTQNLTAGITYTATVGNGGAGSTNQLALGANGQNSSISGTGLTTITSAGGGAGGSRNSSNGGANAKGQDGGSGGGSSTQQSDFGDGNTPTTSPSQGNNGGGAGGNTYGGAGGGAGATGANGGDSGAGQIGAVGVSNSITGSAVGYAGGGSGGVTGSNVTAANAFGGGTGGCNDGQNNGGNGTANTGGGGGGASNTNGNGGNGGSGVVILSIPTSNYSSTTTGSPTITTSGSNTIIKFTSSGTYTS